MTRTSYCGIDFGTSNSAIAAPHNNNIRLLPVEGDSATLPSAIFYAASRTPTYGRQAQKLFFEGEEGRFMRSLKRILGTSLMAQGTVVNGKIKKFEDIIGDFIRHLKTGAEKSGGQTLDSVVMGRPVHFIDHDPGADGRAEDELAAIARAQGFKDVLFQFEPIAAAFAHEQNVAKEKLALVVDIGGGTSDFTVIRVCRDYAAKDDRSGDILGNAGVRVGGNDFDKGFSLACFMPAFGSKSTYGGKRLHVPASPFHELSEWSKVNFLYTPRNRKMLDDILAESHSPKKFGRFVNAVEREIGHRILATVEEAKITLTAATAHDADLNFVESDFHLPLTREAFDASAEVSVEKIGQAMDECLAGANVTADKIEIIILTGGPTETPLLKNLVRTRFPAAEISEENKLSSVALGLGFDSQRKFG
ncbi:MAG: Hsp70 family protein [Micavibrio sp.]|nr:Hsp70 family protein [Micavibrio sp.]